ncbi:Rv2253/PknI dimerization domain-containing protein [Mycolicibacterium mengxianglii]|uniref:hypothetical protein n=1 Tax=Mycolicibacterium mengxianglii TaxID=2736649 RepID=UPI001E2F6532|nr:hypothetical protein [Mycolicibacterium mengxianglii]
MSTSVKSATVAALVTGAAVATIGIAPPAGANDEWGINGTFATSSNGDWAKVNERYHDEPVVRSTWTINTVCSTPMDCAGTVNSDQGWSAPIYTTNGVWYIKRVVPNWKFCADGSPVEGMQIYRIYPVGPEGYVDTTSDEYTGEDQTVGPSGSCGRNQWPQIRMPFYMKKI